MKTFVDWLRSKGYTPQNISTYYEACTHSSYANEHHQGVGDNERLEFIGDSVLQIWSADTLFHMRPALNEGKMTTIRAQTVCESTLAKLNRELGWNKFLRLGVGEEKSGGRSRNSILADHFEACIGAVYIDLGYEAAKEILDEYLKPQINAEKSEDVTDYKTQLQEYVQTDNRSTIQYRMLSESGPSNAPTFVMGVFLDDMCMGTGESSTKKRAEQKAAKHAIAKLAGKREG
jgi:ribonuclease-3